MNMKQEDLDIIGVGIANEAPGLLKGEARKAMARMLHADVNKDGHADVLQLINFAEEAAPLFILLDQTFDFEKVGAELAKSPLVKDHAKLALLIEQAGKLAEQAAKFIPVK